MTIWNELLEALPSAPVSDARATAVGSAMLAHGRRLAEAAEQRYLDCLAPMGVASAEQVCGALGMARVDHVRRMLSRMEDDGLLVRVNKIGDKRKYWMVAA